MSALEWLSTEEAPEPAELEVPASARAGVVPELESGSARRVVAPRLASCRRLRRRRSWQRGRVSVQKTVCIDCSWYRSRNRNSRSWNCRRRYGIDHSASQTSFAAVIIGIDPARGGVASVSSGRFAKFLRR